MATKRPTALHDVAVVGAFNTRQARLLPDETSLSITLDAIRGALADAGLAPHDVNGVNVNVGLASNVTAFHMAHMLGGQPSWMGAARMGVPAVLEAASAIGAGLCDTVVLAAGQAGAYSEREKVAPWTRPQNEFVECWGLYTAAEFALIARRHMHLYGTKPEHLAEVAATIRNHGHINPDAVYYERGPFTPQDILDSRMVADPYHLLDCAMTSEGGAGLILTTVERARDLPGPHAYVLGGAMERMGPSYVMAPVWDRYGMVGRTSARKAFAMAGITPHDVDVCEFYDPFSFEIIRQFEAFEFCPQGEGGPFVMDGRIHLDGDFPVCTNGGTMSFSHAGLAQMLQKVIAGTDQVRGRMGPLQAPDVKVAMCTNGGAAALFAEVLLLGNEPA